MAQPGWKPTAKNSLEGKAEEQKEEAREEGTGLSGWTQGQRGAASQ